MQSCQTSEFHPQAGEHLADFIVKLSRDGLSFLLLRAYELVRELPHPSFRVLRSNVLLRVRSFEMDDAVCTEECNENRETYRGK